MSEKLSDRLWDLLNEATVRNELNATQLCVIDEARALAKHVEDAPLATAILDERECPIIPCDLEDGQRVRLLVEGNG